ncbi:hypothetical protein ACP4OV_001492 [Aristida adscensionis]
MERVKTGSVWTAMAHIISVLIGSSVLALPWTFAQLGWVAGPAVLVAFFGVTYYTSALLSDCYRQPDPITATANQDYVDAVFCYLGPRKAFWCGLVQYSNIWASLVGYTITVSASTSAIFRISCSHRVGLGDGDTCGSGPGIGGVSVLVAFCAIQVPFSQLPNLDNVTWLSFTSVATSFGYSIVCLGLCFAKWASHHGDIRGSLVGTTAISSPDKLFNIFLAIGNVATSFVYADVLIEIQETLRSPPAEGKTMKKASLYSLAISTMFYLLLGSAGYAALGDGAPGNILDGVAFREPFWLMYIANACVVVHFLAGYQVFAQPLFARLESSVSRRWPAAWFVKASYELQVPGTSITMKLTPMKLVLRMAVIVVTTLVAALMPFFNAVLGLIGAIGFWPLSVYFPVSMHIARLKIQRREARWWMLQIMSFCCLLVSVGISVASVKDIVDNLKKAAPAQESLLIE